MHKASINTDNGTTKNAPTILAKLYEHANRTESARWPAHWQSTAVSVGVYSITNLSSNHMPSFCKNEKGIALRFF